MERRHHINNWVYGIQPDAYESEWVPKKTGLVMHELHCSLGGTFNQTSAGVTPGNYQVWLTDKSAGNITDGFWPSWSVSGHNGGIRYCRIKTVAERDYKLVIDTLEDKVLVVDPSDSRTDMPIGMERGIALRYMNREHRIILRKYSEIQNEAVELMNGITLEV